MITVKCGYDGCDFEASSGLLDALPFSESDNLFMRASRANIGLSDELVLMGKLIDHQVQAHGIPPAIWER